jgi:hypothetical protein
MKLKKNINNIFIIFKDKFINCTPSTISSGDFIKLKFFGYNDKRRGGSNFRVKEQIFLLKSKKRKKNTLTYLVMSLYKTEKVKWRYIISAPQVLNITFLKKYK